MIMNTPQIQDFAGKRIHMIGIGGSSMSGLAQMLQHLGYQVTGSDQNDGYLMNDVRQAGAKVTIGHRAENVHGADLVVYTAAIPLTNPERAEAERLHIPSMERAELLGQLMRHYARAIGICGAHGKTTTTSMLSEILVECGLDPSVHIGGKLDAIGGSTRIGHSDIFAAEACEFNRSFLHMHPTMAVVLNIDADHLDCYKERPGRHRAFQSVGGKLQPVRRQSAHQGDRGCMMAETRKTFPRSAIMTAPYARRQGTASCRGRAYS